MNLLVVNTWWNVACKTSGGDRGLYWCTRQWICHRFVVAFVLLWMLDSRSSWGPSVASFSYNPIGLQIRDAFWSFCKHNEFQLAHTIIAFCVYGLCHCRSSRTVTVGIPSKVGRTAASVVTTATHFLQRYSISSADRSALIPFYFLVLSFYA